MKKYLFILILAALLLPGIVSAQQRDAESRDWRWSLRSNGLLPLTNVGAGYTFGPKGRFSLGVDWYYPWIWPPRSGRWCFELLAAGAEARWTFRDGTDPYRRGTGFSIGLGGMTGYFDMGRNYMGFQGEAIAAILDARWTFPINKGRWRLGVGVGGGYLYARIRDYEVKERYGDLYRTGEWTRRINYWGPLRADVTLQIPIWHDVKREER